MSEWTILPLGECMEAIIDYRGKTPVKTTSGVPLVTAKIVKNGRIETPSEFIALEDYDGWMTRGLPKKGDVVLTTEAPLGEVAQIAEPRIALAQRIITLRGKSGLLDNTYLKFLLQGDFVRSQLFGRSSGSTVSGIKQSELRKIELPIPPLENQIAIGDALGSLDDKIELNRCMNETLEAMARALFKDWFIDFRPVRTKMEGRQPPGLSSEIAALFPDKLDEEGKPEGWQRSSVGDQVSVVGGNTPSTKEFIYWDAGTHHWATPKDLSALSSPVLISTERKITNDGLQQISSGLLPADTLLLSSRAPIGYLAIAEVPTAINQGFIAMKCDKKLSNLFVLFWCKENMDRSKASANGSTFQEISKTNFRPISLLMPSEPILRAYDDISRPLYRRIVSNVLEIDRLASLRDAMLPCLLSGDLCVRHSELAVDRVA